MADIEHVFITTIVETCDPVGVPSPLSSVSIIGAIKLSEKDNLLASARF